VTFQSSFLLLHGRMKKTRRQYCVTAAEERGKKRKGGKGHGAPWNAGAKALSLEETERRKKEKKREKKEQL